HRGLVWQPGRTRRLARLEERRRVRLHLVMMFRLRGGRLGLRQSARRKTERREYRNRAAKDREADQGTSEMKPQTAIDVPALERAHAPANRHGRHWPRTGHMNTYNPSIRRTDKSVTLPSSAPMSISCGAAASSRRGQADIR